MDDLINNIKKKLSTDNLVEMMKDAKVIDNQRVKEEYVRETLDKIDPINLIDVEELAAKLNEITEEAAAKEDINVKVTENSKGNIFTIQGIANEDDDKAIKESDLRNTLKKIDPNSPIDVDDLTEAAFYRDVKSSIKPLDNPRASNSIFGKVLGKTELEMKDDNEDNASGFLD